MTEARPVLQEFKLFRRAVAAQHRVAVRKAAKAGHDVAVQDGVLQVVGQDVFQTFGRARVQALKTGHAGVLLGQGFGVHQRHVDKHPASAGQGGVFAGVQRALAQGLGAGIAGKGAGLAPVDVAAELVQQQDERQAGQGLRDPGAEATGLGQRQALRLTGGEKLRVISYADRVEFIPVRPMKQMRGYLRGMDTARTRDPDRL